MTLHGFLREAEMSRKKVDLAGLTLGGDKIYIQSMLNVPAWDVEGSVVQAKALEEAGCPCTRQTMLGARRLCR